MPYVTYDPENGRYFHVDLASWLAGEQFMRVLDAVRDSSLANEADEPPAPASVTLEEAMARVMDQVLAREGDTHALWRHLNTTWKP